MFLNGGFSELKVFLEGWNREHPSQRVHQGIHLQNTWYMLWMQLLALNAANSNYPFKQECFIWERESMLYVSQAWHGEVGGTSSCLDSIFR